MRLEELVVKSDAKLRIVAGSATSTDAVSIGGLEQPAVWADHVQAAEGDALLILMMDYATAQSQAVVVGRTGRYASPADPAWEGTVATAPVGSETITINTTAGEVTATFVSSYTPAVGDRVGLQWQGQKVRVLGKVGVTPTPPPPAPAPDPKPKTVAPPPPKKASGTESFAAADSATWSTGTGSWNSYYGKHLYQGSYGSTGANRGAWFYHGRPGKLAGKSITDVEIYIPARRRAGSYNQPVTLNVYLHGSKRRPGGDVTRSASTTINIPAGFTGGWFDLPASWGDDLTENGAGIGIAGGSYAGITGLPHQRAGRSEGVANSGQLRLRWTD